MQELYIEDDAQLDEYCQRLSRAGWLALDTEFIRERTYFAKLCLLQIATDQEVACIDPLALSDLQPLLTVIFDPAILKIVHSARQDFELFYDLCGKLPQPVFDTQVAAALSGLGDQIGYGALVKDITGVELEKAHTRTDWCQRPLSAAQLHYAREDVLYLRQLQERLSDRLVKLGRQAWLEEEQGTLCDPVTYQNDPRQAYLRLRNLSALPVEVQSRARVLAEWRETFARERNQPRRWILTDQQLLNIAREAPASSAELATVPEVPEKLARRRAPQILQALERASADELQQLPASVMRLSNPQKALAKRMMDKVRECAQANQLAASILATRKDVDALIRGDRELPLLHGWRHELIGRHLLEMMAAEQP